MMIFESVELYNVAEARRTKGKEGLLLQRVPESVRQNLNAFAKVMMQRAANCEIRFVMQGDSARITLSREADLEEPWNSQVHILFGRYYMYEAHRIGIEPSTIEISLPWILKVTDFAKVKDESFSPLVCRILLPYAGQIRLHDVEGQLRPPTAEEVPGRRMLAYGTSITEGSFATASHLTYPAQAAWRLKSDLINLGSGGSCFCDPAIAEHIAKRDDWDFAVLELSVNLFACGITAADFREKAGWFVHRIAKAHPDRLIACITLFPFSSDIDGKPLRQSVCPPEDYRRALRRIVKEIDSPNVILIEGSHLLTDMSNLCADVLHPGDYGMMQIAENLAARLKDRLLEKRDRTGLTGN